MVSRLVRNTDKFVKDVFATKKRRVSRFPSVACLDIAPRIDISTVAFACRSTTRSATTHRRRRTTDEITSALIFKPIGSFCWIARVRVRQSNS